MIKQLYSNSRTLRRFNEQPNPCFSPFNGSKFIVLFLILVGSWTSLSAQHLQPGFDLQEYRELISIIARSSETPEKAKLIPHPTQSEIVYQSKPIGLDNLWELWIKDQKIAVLCTRGSTASSESWLANLYAAMVPAKGMLKLNPTEPFHYELSFDPRTAVHVGYLISMAFIAKEMLPKIDSCYQKGIRDFIITGHSQGGGISYLLTAHFYSLQKQGKLPADIRFKTYCSAAPKPGNLYFAYSYESTTSNDWAFNVVNSEDWVPQTPFSVQMLTDLPETSPVPLLEEAIKKQSFPKRIVFNTLYGKLRNPSRKSVKNYQKFLGHEISKKVKVYLPDFDEPSYFNSNHYVRTGNTIVLYPDEGYFNFFSNESKDVMIHHSLPPYLYLLKRLEER
jgi:hypothetical protein